MFFWAVPAPALAAPLRIDITYSEGKIVSGPLTPDLEALPELVFASFTLNDAAGTLDNMLASSLVFGDAAWDVSDLESFTATFLPTDSGELAVTALSYSYRAKNTPTTNGKLAANFPLVIQGTDIASGEPFHYQYDTSTQTVTEVPEPSSFALAALGILGLMATARRRSPMAHRIALVPTSTPCCIRSGVLRGGHKSPQGRIRSMRAGRLMTTLLLVLMLIAVIVWPLSVSATTIVFDTFGPGNSYDEDFKYSGGEFHFQTAESGALASITVALGRASTETTTTTFSLLEQVDFTFFLLESWVVPNDTPALPSPGAIVTFDSVAQPTLLVGHSYWLAMASSFPSSLWFFNDQGIGQDVFPFTTTMPAFRVETVPEPGAAVLLMVGAVFALVLRRRFLSTTQGVRPCAVHRSAW
jgi:hypothetical protein